MNPPRRSHNKTTTAINKTTRGERGTPSSACPSGAGVYVAIERWVGVGLSVEVGAGNTRSNAGNGSSVVVGVREGVGVMVKVAVGPNGVRLC